MARAQGRSERAALRELRAIYRHADAAYARFSCPASAECCQLAKTQRQPWLYLLEWRLLRATGPLPPPRADGACPYLDASGRRCTAYDARPLGCRTFFCGRVTGPARQPREAVIQLTRRIERVSALLDASDVEPRPLLEWHARSLPVTSGACSPAAGSSPPRS